MFYNKRYFFMWDMKEDNPKYIKLKEYYILYLKLTSIQKKIIGIQIYLSVILEEEFNNFYDYLNYRIPRNNPPP